MNGNAKTQAHIGRNIARIRAMKGMKQSALANAMDISQQAISKIEQSAFVKHNVLLHVSEALGVDVKLIESFDDKILGEG